MIKKILFISLSNIGDAVLSLPALDHLKANFPEAKVTVISGERPKELFEQNPWVEKVIVFDKRAPLKEQLGLFKQLKKEKFDLVVDLRDSFFGRFLAAGRNSSFFLKVPAQIKHMKDRHLYRALGSRLKVLRGGGIPAGALHISPQDAQYVERLLETNSIRPEDKIIVVAPGARSHTKRWPEEKFVQLLKILAKEQSVKIILVGDKNDSSVNKYIAGNAKCPLLDLSDKTSLAQLACLLKRGALLITNDSASMHLASYIGTPVVAIFGPTDEKKYGPWSVVSEIVKKDISCRPCAKAQCRFESLACLNLVKVEDVMRAGRKILAQGSRLQAPGTRSDFKRILLVRTDRIGDVLLSTPVIKALRDHYPHAYIAMMVAPYAKEVVEGNPWLDEVIIYDKDAKHKSWRRTLKFSRNLAKKRFDLVIALHPTNRAHMVTFLAGIPKRLGYDRKLAALLTDKIAHSKQLGEKHELEYNLDFLRHLGIEAQDKRTHIPLKPESEKWAVELLEKENITAKDKLLGIHPGASCPSKIWPVERLAQVADKLAEKYGFKVIILAGPKDLAKAEVTQKQMRHPVLNLAGKTSVSQMASILKRCALFISNDSGPVHIAGAVGTPVISIFGRAQKGLSPKRWGPLGKRDRVLHKPPVGCVECLAHNCVKGFACLKAISVDDVVGAADEILKS